MHALQIRQRAHSQVIDTTIKLKALLSQLPGQYHNSNMSSALLYKVCTKLQPGHIPCTQMGVDTPLQTSALEDDTPWELLVHHM